MYFSVCCWLQTLTCNLFTLSSPKFLPGGMLKRLYVFCWFCSSFFSTKRLGAVLLTSFSLWFLGRLKCNRSTGHSESTSFIISPKDFHSRTLFRDHGTGSVELETPAFFSRISTRPCRLFAWYFHLIVKPTIPLYSFFLSCLQKVKYLSVGQFYTNRIFHFVYTFDWRFCPPPIINFLNLDIALFKRQYTVVEFCWTRHDGPFWLAFYNGKRLKDSQKIFNSHSSCFIFMVNMCCVCCPC